LKGTTAKGNWVKPTPVTSTLNWACAGKCVKDHKRAAKNRGKKALTEQASAKAERVEKKNIRAAEFITPGSKI
jgi:hypothetical protein